MTFKNMAASHLASLALPPWDPRAPDPLARPIAALLAQLSDETLRREIISLIEPHIMAGW
jgi:hypothetical protein